MQNPLSIPGGWNKDTPRDTPAEEKSNPGSSSSVPSPYLALIIPVTVDSQSVPRSNVGVVSETGDVVDEAGKNIGKVAESEDPKDLVGNTVTTGGDVVSTTGDILGKAVPLDDPPSEYTTASGEKPKKSSGFGFSGLKSVYNTVDGTMKPVTSRLGFGSRSGVASTPEDKSASQGEETEKQFREAQGKGSSSEIDLKDEDPLSATGKETGVESKDKLTEVPPDPVESTKEADVEAEQENSIKPDDIKPDDSISRFDPTSEDPKEAPPTSDVKDTSAIDATDVPPSDAPKSTAESEATKSAPPTDAPKSEVSKSEVPEGSEIEKPEDAPESEVSKSEVPKPEVPESEVPGSEVPKSEVPESEVPKSLAPESEVPKSEVAESEVPKSEVPESQIPRSEAPLSEVPPSEVPKSEAPGSEVPGSEALKSVVSGTEAPKSAVSGTEAPKSAVSGTEAPESAVSGTEAPKSTFSGTEAPKSVVSGTEIPGSEAPEGEIPEGEVPEGEVAEGEAPEDEAKLDYAALEGCKVNKGGNLINDKGEIVGRVVEGEVKQLIGKKADENGDIWNDAGKKVGKGEPLPDNEREDLKDFAPFENFPGATVEADGRVLFEGKQVGQVVEGDPKRLKGSKVDEDGDILDRRGNVIGKAEAWDEPEEEDEPEIDYSILAGKRVNKAGNVVGENGELYGRVIQGHIGSLIGRMCDKDGNVRSESGEVIGKVELVPEDQRQGTRDGPFADLVGCTVTHEGKIATATGEIVGRLIEGDAKALYGRPIDEDGDILDRNGNTIGKAERWEEPEPEAEPEVEIDHSILAGKRVNKAGNVVGSNGELYGRVIEGHIGSLIGRMCDKDGNIRSESGDIIGRAELVPEDQREGTRDGPFADLEGCTVAKEGKVTTSSGEVVGRLTEGDEKALYGRPVDEDGDILDRNGNVIGKAERWEEPEAEPEAEIDYSSLAGKRVNKAGNLVDSSGNIYGRVVEGHIGSVIGRMADKDGNIRSESGGIIGRAELVTEGEREGTRDGPFAELVGCTVTKEGKVVTATGDVVGRLVSGDPKVLYGRGVDEDGDILDRNGNVIGKAERYEEPEVQKKVDPLAGRRVNREGNVVDEDGNLIGKLTSGDLFICSGKEVDADGDVVDGKGQTIGHVSRLEDIPPEPESEPEPEVEVEEETPEAKEAREQLEKDVKLAGQIAGVVEQSLDKIRPICKLITDKVDTAERTPKEELDEEELVKQVRPLIEEGGRILTEVNGAIRGLDPDGRIQQQSKAKAASRDATPEEAHLAEVLKELTGTVTQCIDNAKRKIDNMPHAKGELNPLWGLLAEPLFQILAAVGLLLNGVLGLVGRLLSIVGLGGVIDSLLGGLGVNKILRSLGLGSALTALTGKKEKKNTSAPPRRQFAQRTMRLLLIRHGETVDNVAGLYAGSRDSPLTTHGVLQARRLASHLAGRVTVQHLFSSDLQRATRTAEAVRDAQKRARETDLVVVQLKDLREKDFGSGEGSKIAAGEHEGAETPEAMRLRVDRFLDDHLVPVLAVGESTVCVVAHGIILGVLFKALSARIPCSIAPSAKSEFSDVSALSRLWWSNTGYLEGVLSTSTIHSDGRLPLKLSIETINGMDHVKGLKRTRGGIGSAKFDEKQKTMDSFFKPTSRKRKHDDK
ncbi:hypothetical protein G7Z17_g4006 [Cylindrodendrum hubeiense]|uniref:DUF6987 domain-containing protein n=1 Tax=Cylindrodendrum hubeiense TaxID=595255 RepID=A0A9P5HES9_9HYPO|nr:hypothetical protein G7Z17_g4006 [Cylindrodendrum hubeiense]